MLNLLKEWETEGLVHTVWTFGTPFIAGICNCDRSDCMAMLATVGRGVQLMFRAEFVAAVDEDLCTGCRSCMRVCQFGAIGYSADRRKIVIDASRCYGCGLCRAVCPQEAITLKDRAAVPAAANRW
jgi:MinD superfamily P-loop ATPase